MGKREDKSPPSPTNGSNASASSSHVPSRKEIALIDLHPTQMTVGYAEVLLKRQQWRAMDDVAKSSFIARNPMPAVIGPKGRYFIVDHHHLARALLDENVSTVRTTHLADLSALNKNEFWNVMNYQQWVHAYDSKGRKHPCSNLPKKVSGLANDPYRSLAAAVRINGGFPKEQTPFAEFIWADFFRRRISAELLDDDPSAALAKALPMAHDRSASHLPGWSPRLE